MKKNMGFTLIELLVVIAIIGILMSILLPAVGAAFKKSKTTRAYSEVRGIEMAIKAYVQEYGKFPLQDNATKDVLYDAQYPYSEVMDILKGDNPRNILFLEIENTTDPWDEPYKIAADWDFNNKLEKIPFPGKNISDPKITVEGRNVIVWSVGNTNIVSWK